MEVLYAVLLLGGLGIIFGTILAVCAEAFKVETDTRTEDVLKMLPNYNCGACGFPGCAAFAEAVVKGEITDYSRCKVIKPEGIKKIETYMNKNKIKPEEKKNMISSDMKD